jgi:hypothetical protein
MARPKKITLNAINISVHPHTPAHYSRLWSALFELKRAIDIGRDQALMIGAIEQIDPKKPEAGYMGLLFRFTTIDKNKGWFNLESGVEADPDTVKREVKIPDNLRPNLSTFHYRLFPKSHRLVIENKNANGDSLGAAAVEKMITHLAADPKISKTFKNIDATMEQSEEHIDDILTGKVLKRLIITVKRPNPDDDSDDDERHVLGELLEEKVRTKTIALSALSGQSIRPSPRTKRFARVAKSNGRVQAIEETADGKRVPVSSKSHPRVDQFPYSESTQTRTDAFLAAARAFVASITSNKKNDVDTNPPVV